MSDPTVLLLSLLLGVVGAAVAGLLTMKPQLDLAKRALRLDH